VELDRGVFHVTVWFGRGSRCFFFLSFFFLLQRVCSAWLMMMCGSVLFVVAWRRRVVRMAGKESFAPALLGRALRTWRLAGASVRLAEAARALNGEAQQLAEALASAEGSWELCRDDLAASEVCLCSWHLALQSP
jgi:hypothetical protein